MANDDDAVEDVLQQVGQDHGSPFFSEWAVCPLDEAVNVSVCAVTIQR